MGYQAVVRFFASALLRSQANFLGAMGLLNLGPHQLPICLRIKGLDLVDKIGQPSRFGESPQLWGENSPLFRAQTIKV